MRQWIPVLIASTIGLLMVVASFSPPLARLEEIAQSWFTIVSAIALIVGSINLVQHHTQSIAAQQAGWGYSLVTLVAFVVTATLGLLKVGVPAPTDRPWSGNYVAEGSALWWLFEYVQMPIVSMMFALLAFSVTSAAFRAFRAKNTEAALLLGTAIIVLLGRTYAGTLLTGWIPEYLSGLTFPGMTITIVSVFSLAGQRAILIGVALGVAAVSLRVLLGIDRSYLGGEEG